MDCVAQFIRAASNHPFGCGFKAMLLTYAKRPRESCELLRPIIDWFPNHATMHYDLAHAAAECGLWAEARHWLYRAFAFSRFSSKWRSTIQLSPQLRVTSKAWGTETSVVSHK